MAKFNLKELKKKALDIKKAKAARQKKKIMPSAPKGSMRFSKKRTCGCGG